MPLSASDGAVEGLDCKRGAVVAPVDDVRVRSEAVGALPGVGVGATGVVRVLPLQAGREIGVCVERFSVDVLSRGTCVRRLAGRAAVDPPPSILVTRRVPNLALADDSRLYEVGAFPRRRAVPRTAVLAPGVAGPGRGVVIVILSAPQ